MRFLLLDFGQPFDLETYYHEPLGGSETSLGLLSKGLSEIGNKVYLATMKPIYAQYNENLIQLPLHQLRDYNIEIDLVIVNRNILNLPEFIWQSKVPIYVYLHDAYDQDIVKWLHHKNIVNRISKFFTVSKWQRDTLSAYFKININKFFVLGNSIDTLLYSNKSVKKQEHKFIFASIPYKGLENIPDIWNLLNKEIDSKGLRLDIFSSMKLYNQPDEDKYYAQYFDILNSYPNVYLHNPISMKELASELLSSKVYLHPTNYHETFGMILVQAMLSGTLPITPDIGAVSEIVPEELLLKDCKDLRYLQCKEKYVEKVLEVMNNNYKFNFSYLKKYDYINIAKRLFTNL